MTAATRDSFSEALTIIDDALTFGINPSLEPMEKICALLGNPQQRFVCIQVGGTNGKSSTSRYMAALLRDCGYATGLYTSPELVSVTDRIELGGVSVDEDLFARAIVLVHTTACDNALELTEFELITAAALRIFAERNVEFAVLEVGLGGRWDATSVVTPALAVLTGVDLDHTAILGSTIAEIAAEKAAIIKPGTQTVAAPTDAQALEVFRSQAREQNARFIEVPLAVERETNSYQAQNRLTAITAIRALLGANAVNDVKAIEVLNSTIIPGRLEVLRRDPLLTIDAAHNPASAQTLARAYGEPRTILLLAILADKDARGIIEALAPLAEEIVVTQTASSRAIPAEDLAQVVQSVTGSEPRLFASPAEALEVLFKQTQPILATGSITLAGEVKLIIQGLPQIPSP